MIKVQGTRHKVQDGVYSQELIFEKLNIVY